MGVVNHYFTSQMNANDDILLVIDLLSIFQNKTELVFVYFSGSFIWELFDCEVKC